MDTEINQVIFSKTAAVEQEAKYFLAAIVESSQDSIVTIDLHRKITTWNKAAESLYGYKAKEVVGQPLEMLMLPKDIVQLIENMNKIADELYIPIYDTVRFHKNWKQADLQIALSPVRNSVDEVAKLYEQLKDEFIAIASHELKTPVTSIKGYAQILVKEFKDSADEKNYIMLTRLEHQIDRLIDLIKNLLDTTRLTTWEVLLNIVPFDLGLLIEEQVDIFQRISTKHQIIFEVEKGHTVFADRKMVAQVISNFISNAVKYSPNGGQIINSSAKTKQGFKVSVQDFGIGIPEGLDRKIFERYFRIPHQQGTAIPGIGLGLYITAQIIRQHGGKITVESKEGVGSTFSFELPQKI